MDQVINHIQPSGTISNQEQNAIICKPPLILGSYFNKDLGKELKIPKLEGYILKNCLGKGGTAEVYSAIDRSDNLVALKLFNLENPIGEEKFSQEHKNKEKLTKKNDVCANDAVVCPLILAKNQNYGFVIMRLYPSPLNEEMKLYQSFYSKLSKKEKEYLHKFIKWIQSLVNGLYDIHNKLKITHGDIKPENILVDKDNESLLFFDWDTMCIPKDNNCKVTDVSPIYCSPELDKSIQDLSKSRRMLSNALLSLKKTTDIDPKKKEEKYAVLEKEKSKIMFVPIDTTKRSDWWAVCLTILYMWFGEDRFFEVLSVPQTVSDIYSQTKKSEWYDKIHNTIKNDIKDLNILTPNEKKILNELFNGIISVIRAIGLSVNLNPIEYPPKHVHTVIKTHIDNMIGYIRTMDIYLGSETQTGGENNDYYKMKYYKYKAKYMALDN